MRYAKIAGVWVPENAVVSADQAWCAASWESVGGRDSVVAR